MRRFLRLAILTLVFAAFVPQAQTSRSTAAYDCRTDDSDAELNLDGAGTDNDVASTNASPGRVLAGFGFLRRIDKGVIEEFHNAWHVSGEGSNGREGVVLIFRRKDGSYTGRLQGFTNEYKKANFKWSPAALAIVHTHPNSCDPRPSPQDERVAEKYYVPIFTLTFSGMYVYNPATRMTSKVVDGLDWLDLSKWQETDAKLKGCAAQRLESCYKASRRPLLDEPKILRSEGRNANEPRSVSQVDTKR